MDRFPFTSTATVTYRSPWWLVATVDPEICRYYAHWVLVRHGIRLMGSRWEPHITIVRNEEPPDSARWGVHEGREVEFRYSHLVHRHLDTVFWWVRVECPEMLDLREELGLPRESEYHLHITPGREGPWRRSRLLGVG